MKQPVVAALFCLLSFTFGLTASSFSHAQKNAPRKENVSTARATATPSPCPEADDFPRLIDDNYVTKFNGARIDLNSDTGVVSGDDPWAISSAEIIPIGRDDLLISLGDTLYRLNSKRRVVWSYRTPQILFDFAYVEPTNLVYGTAGDNTMFILNATTGKVEVSDSRNGSAAYGVAENYGDDMCLVTDNYVMYREKFRGDKIEPMKDGLTCWRGTKILWHLDFPPDADLAVDGKRILAVTKSKKAIYFKEITPPHTKK